MVQAVTRNGMLVALVLILGVASDGALADETPEDELPLRPERTVDLDTGTATWLSLDVTPDGETLVFDVLGDLYRKSTLQIRTRVLENARTVARQLDSMDEEDMPALEPLFIIELASLLDRLREIYRGR